MILWNRSSLGGPRSSVPQGVQARYAVAIAAAAGAQQYAAQPYASAQEKLTTAETALTGKSAARKTVPGRAREAVIAAEDARRADLLQRLNRALPTRETDRGLGLEIGGVQFATGTAELSAAARASLARFAGIVASYPDLKLLSRDILTISALRPPTTSCRCDGRSLFAII